MALTQPLSRDSAARLVCSIFRDKTRALQSPSAAAATLSLFLVLLSCSLPLPLSPRIQPKVIYTLRVLRVGALFQNVQVGSGVQPWRRPKDVFHDFTGANAFHKREGGGHDGNRVDSRCMKV